MLNKIAKKKILCQTLERFISENQWLIDRANENAIDYEERKNNPDYDWSDFDENELDERKYTVECYETIIAALEKLI